MSALRRVWPAVCAVRHDWPDGLPVGVTIVDTDSDTVQQIDESPTNR